VGVRIVLADDNETVRQLIKTLLETRPEWRVVGEAENGRDAIQKVRELNPDVAILDFSMPGMNGIDATRAIVQELPGTAVVVLTMHDSKTLVRLALRAGARRCLLKPEVTQHLLEAVESLIAPQDVPVSTSSSESGGTKEGHSRVSKKNPRR
jgi:DNA-binding NarL/FixJ family response regulator